MSPAARKAPSSRKKAPSPQKKGGTSTRKPKPSPELREAFEQDVSRVEELDALYRPLREAAEAELSKTKSGRELLEETRAFGTELADLYENIVSGTTPYEEGHRLARRRREEFVERHEEQFLAAYAPHVRLQPSVEAVAQILRPEMAPQTTWLSETAFPRSTLLQPRPAPEDLETAGQALGDPMPPQPVRSCLGPPYARREEYPLAPVLGEARAEAELDGQINTDGWCVASPLFPIHVTIANAWVGHDFAVPAGITSYSATVDYDFNFVGSAVASFGVAVTSMSVGIKIDKGDGTPRESSAQSVHLLTVPFIGGDYFHRQGNVKVTLAFKRVGSTTQAEPGSGTVRVLVGGDCHGVAVGGFGVASFRGGVVVREICLNSTV